MKTLIIVPSRSRPDNVDRLIEAFVETKATADLLIALDDDDEHNYPRRNPRNSPITDFYVGYEVVPSQWIGPTINQLAREYAGEYDYIGFMGDDHCPRTEHWDSILADAIGTFGIAYGNDLLQKDQLPTAVLMSSNIVSTLGYLVPPGLDHLYFDNTWKVWGQGLHRLFYRPDVVIEHLHPLAHKTAWDPTYMKANSAETNEHDKAAFLEYTKKGLAEDLLKLRPLIPKTDTTLHVSLCALHPGTVSASFMLSALRFLNYEQAQKRFQIDLKLRHTSSGDLAVARNVLTKEFLEGGNNYLWMVDSDIGFPENSLERLLSHHLDVVGALCFSLQGVGIDPTTCADRYRINHTLIGWDEGPIRMETYPSDALVQIWSTGAACLLISRAVVEKLYKSYGANWWTPLPNPNPDEPHAILREDMSFFMRLKESGFDAYVDTSVKTSHYKGGVYLTEQAYEQHLIV